MCYLENLALVEPVALLIYNSASKILISLRETL
jgi:hypothetical protein